MTQAIPRRLTALVMALALTAALAAPAAAEEAEDTAWEDMEYVHYEREEFYGRLNELTALAAGEDADSLLALYDELHQQLLWIYTYRTIADIHYNMDVTDEYWVSESAYSDGVVMEADDAFCVACNAVTNGPCAGAFADHIGQERAQFYAEYVPATQRERELADRETALIDEYYQCANERDELTYTYGGEDWTEEEIYGAAGDRLYDRDPAGYWQVVDGLAKAFNDQVGELFLELTQIRREQAQIWEYDSYVDAVYEAAYCRDYTPEEAQMLCDAVKPIAREYHNGLYYSDLWYMGGEVTPVLSAREQISALGRYAARIDPSLARVWQTMTERGLCYLTDASDSIDTGFTSDLYGYGCPFIYNRLYNNCRDLDDLSHEFGHFADACLHPNPDPVTDVGSFDLFEIHSTGMEGLFTAYYDEIYDEGVNAAKFLVLDGLLESVITGCIQDEFQRRVFAEEQLSLDRVNEIFTEVCGEYGLETGPVAYDWQDVSHNFDRPLYFISYAVSALAAIQIWDMAQTDWDRAVEVYMDVLERGAYDDGYMTVLADCGMRLFTEEGAVEDICRPLMDCMQALEDEELGQAA